MIGVTGATGLLGSYLVRKLLGQGEAVTAFRRTDSDLSLLHAEAEKITWRTLDVKDPVSVEEGLKGISVLIHAAALVSFNPRDKQRLIDTNVMGTRNVVNGCLAAGVERLVHVSSVAALGRTRGQTLIREDNPWTDNPLNSAYAESKYLAELEVFRGHEEGLKTLVVNPSVILAPADWKKSSARLFHYVWEERPFYISGKMNYVDVRDVTHIIYTLMKGPYDNSRYILNAGTVSFEDFFNRIAKLFNKKAPRVRLNKTLLQLATRLEALRAWVLNREPLITAETARLDGADYFYDPSKIKTALNFEFQTLDETLKWCCEYYIKAVNGKILR